MSDSGMVTRRPILRSSAGIYPRLFRNYRATLARFGQALIIWRVEKLRVEQLESS
jgi:hypothetical protein